MTQSLCPCGIQARLSSALRAGVQGRRRPLMKPFSILALYFSAPSHSPGSSGRARESPRLPMSQRFWTRERFASYSRSVFEVGKVYRRRSLQEEHGGQRQGGIVTPAGRPVILLIAGEGGREPRVRRRLGQRWDVPVLRRGPAWLVLRPNRVRRLPVAASESRSSASATRSLRPSAKHRTAVAQ